MISVVGEEYPYEGTEFEIAIEILCELIIWILVDLSTDFLSLF